MGSAFMNVIHFGLFFPEKDIPLKLVVAKAEKMWLQPHFSFHEKRKWTIAEGKSKKVISLDV